MNRRTFIQVGSASLIAGYGSGLDLLSQAPDKADLVEVLEVESINENTFPKAFEALGGLNSLIKKSPAQSLVLIKPNICLPQPPKNGTTTSVHLLELLVGYLTASGIGRIIIADHTLMKSSDFENIELAGMLKKYPAAALLLANEQRYFEKVDFNGKVLNEAEILRLIKKSDLFINFATAKHHAATHVSLCIKNLMGCIWNRSDFHTKFDLSQGIGDLCLALKPHINIIDATRILLNGGPAGPGQLKNDDRIFVSRDILAIDSIVAARYNFGGRSVKPNEIAHLSASYANGAGEINDNKILLRKIQS